MIDYKLNTDNLTEILNNVSEKLKETYNGCEVKGFFTPTVNSIEDQQPQWAFFIWFKHENLKDRGGYGIYYSKFNEDDIIDSRFVDEIIEIVA